MLLPSLHLVPPQPWYGVAVASRVLIPMGGALGCQAMLRVGGLVAFTALGSAYITRRSTLNLKMGFALALVVAGVSLASYTHISDEAGFRLSSVSLLFLHRILCVPPHSFADPVLFVKTFDMQSAEHDVEN